MSDRHVLATCALLGVVVGLGPLAGFALPSPPSPGTSVDDLAGPVAVAEAKEDRSSADLVVSEPDSQDKASPSPTRAPADDATGTGSDEEPDEPAGEAAREPTAEPEPTPESILDDDQLIVFYGTPLASGLGILGMFPAEEAARRVQDHAAYYDSLNGERGARGALDLIYALVQAEQTPDGLYLRYLPDSTVREYILVAEKYDLELILDLQIGRGNLLEEVRKIERFLLHPRVHVAIDPEYAVGPTGIPIYTPGTITGNDMNAIQDYLRDLVVKHSLPPKLLVIHQYMDSTVLDWHETRLVPEVNLVLNMDAFGNAEDKRKKYNLFAVRPYAEYRGFNIFLKQDNPVMTEQETLDLSPQPDVIFYQ